MQTPLRADHYDNEAIIQQEAWVRKLRRDGAVESEIEEAGQRLRTLKANYEAATCSEWSDVREEGPILLTSNKVRGDQILPKLRESLKELRKENVIR